MPATPAKPSPCCIGPASIPTMTTTTPILPMLITRIVLNRAEEIDEIRTLSALDELAKRFIDGLALCGESSDL